MSVLVCIHRCLVRLTAVTLEYLNSFKRRVRFHALGTTQPYALAVSSVSKDA
jgi:hypothetical protein